MHLILAPVVFTGLIAKYKNKKLQRIINTQQNRSPLMLGKVVDEQANQAREKEKVGA